MDPETHLAALRRDIDAFAAAARAGPLDARVPPCPDWDVERLVGHLGRVHRWIRGWIAEGRSPESLPRPPEGDAVVTWFDEGAAALLEALAAIEPQQVVPTWAGDLPAAFWPRRMAHEAAIHRWDAQSARDATEPIAAELAVDGIDELLEIFVTLRLGRETLAGAGETIHLHATDAEGEWLLTFADDGLQWEHAHAKGDVAVRAPASDLALLLWNRRDHAGLEVFGDAALLERWRERVRVG